MEVAMEDAQVVMADVQVAMEDAEVSLSPVPAAKKMRRLRKVRETEIEVNEEPVSEVVSEKSRGDAEVGRETAEEILKRFGKGGGDGKKRKAVQRTILAAVVDMSKQTTESVDVEGEPPVGDTVEPGVEDSDLEPPSHGGDEPGVEDGGLELRSYGEELAVCPEGDILFKSVMFAYVYVEKAIF